MVTCGCISVIFTTIVTVGLHDVGEGMRNNDKARKNRLTTPENLDKIQVSPSYIRVVRSYDWIRGHVLGKRGHHLAGYRAKLERCWNNTNVGSRDRQHVENIIWAMEDRRWRPDCPKNADRDQRLLRRLDKKRR